MNPLLLCLLAYLLGSTPTSLWVARAFHGLDLREHGSGNLGATNTFRVLGWKAALPVLGVDVGKGYLPVILFPALAAPASEWSWVVAYGGAAIVGHVFSVWVRFRGGKGVATSAGVFLGLAPWALLVAFSVWLAVVLATRLVSLGSILAALTAPLAVWWIPRPEGQELVVGFTLALGAFVLWAHRANIRRLLRGEEPRFGRAREEG